MNSYARPNMMCYPNPLNILLDGIYLCEKSFHLNIEKIKYDD